MLFMMVQMVTMVLNHDKVWLGLFSGDITKPSTHFRHSGDKHEHFADVMNVVMMMMMVMVMMLMMLVMEVTYLYISGILTIPKQSECNVNSYNKIQ